MKNLELTMYAIKIFFWSESVLYIKNLSLPVEMVVLVLVMVVVDSNIRILKLLQKSFKFMQLHLNQKSKE